MFKSMNHFHNHHTGLYRDVHLAGITTDLVSMMVLRAWKNGNAKTQRHPKVVLQDLQRLDETAALTPEEVLTCRS